MAASRSSRRCSSSGTLMPSGRSAPSASSASRINCSTSARSCASILHACSQLSALCLEALACTFVPSRLTLPSFSTPSLLRHAQNLHEQRAQLLEKPLAEVRNRIVVRMLVRRHVAQRHRVVRLPLQLAARKHPGRVSVEQQRHHHRRVKGVRPASAVRSRQLAQIQPLHDLDNKPRQMILRQPLLYRRRQQVRACRGPRSQTVRSSSPPHPLEPLRAGVSYHNHAIRT